MVIIRESGKRFSASGVLFSRFWKYHYGEVTYKIQDDSEECMEDDIGPVLLESHYSYSKGKSQKF